MSEFTRFQVVRQDDVTIIRLLDPELSDLLIQDSFLEEIMSLLSDDTLVNLVINCSIVNYCNSGVINALIRAKKRIVEKHGEIRLCELNEHVLEAFRALNLEGTVFQVFATEAEAIASF
ncbi:MAG: STAS domain-containing protein [Pirellulaceae bacterium]|jgi:anti-anti-sigma factor|nr:STAS domain-containing protein [Pirellulaceae bacterium]HJN08388.1 STAS domain-containing protein [Pirellulaceae bacterium]